MLVPVIGVTVFIILLEHLGREARWTWRPSVLLGHAASLVEWVWTTLGRWAAVILEHFNILQTLADLWYPIQRLATSPIYLVRGYFDYVENQWVHAASVFILLGVSGLLILLDYGYIACLPVAVLLLGVYEFIQRQPLAPEAPPSHRPRRRRTAHHDE